MFYAPSSKQKQRLQELKKKKATSELINFIKKMDSNIRLHWGYYDIFLESKLTPLIKKGADPSQIFGFKRIPEAFSNFYTSPFHYILEKFPRNLESIKLLLEAGAQVNQVPRMSAELPLGLVLEKPDNSKAAELLITYGAETTQPIFYFLAQNENNLDALRFLITHGADVDSYNKTGLGIYGRRPLTIAAGANNIQAVRLLLENGADPNVTEYHANNTAIMYAIKNKNFEMIKLLLENGARTDIKNFEGKTALEFAIEHAGHDIEVLLRNPPPLKKIGLKKLP